MANIVVKKLPNNLDRILFHVDSETVEKKNKLCGWIIDMDSEINRVFYSSKNGKTISEIHLCFPRPKLGESFPDIENSGNSGFEIDHSNFKAEEKYNIKIQLHSGQTISLAEISTVNSILYVHIPKTAGSTINNIMEELLGHSAVLKHVESKSNWKDELQNRNISFCLAI
ncbi:sulfotransferase family 2 domain-containing protein [Thalassotalea sp. PS06]|uniref:sulfotransferase family 2 domain-containing protein n=1 Tax=Thalassotalea sp. PS06 TaxID=2594005 RepID=UPI001163918C|nr:sulfotransferase family 2 domain-containing protein [Thalassotalea sp. PS06]QDP01942.1 hypothetical protein FNC98_11680 [Thalassotalea sp. PS06]